MIPPNRPPGARDPLAVAATVLWQRFLHLDPADPDWPDRDRMVAANPRLAALAHRLLRACGTGPAGADQAWGGYPGAECAQGPPGQAFAAAVGMALAERTLAARFGRTLVDHRVWVLAAEADLAAGLSLEAAALAGRLELDKLAVLLRCAGPGGADAPVRFAATGWAVREVRGDDADAVAAAIARAQRNRRPTLIACLPGAAGTTGATADDDAAATDPAWSLAAARGMAARRAWLRRKARHRMEAEFERQHARRLPPALRRSLGRAATGPGTPAPGADRDDGDVATTLSAARRDLVALMAAVPETVLLHSATGRVAGAASLPFASRLLDCGVQEHGMAAVGNGLSLHGGLRPILGASVVSIDRMRPALRQAALMRQPVVFLLADRADPDAGGAGWPAVEQFASLRAMPHVALFRPADPEELAACWLLALNRSEGPSLIALCDRDHRGDGGAEPNPSGDAWRQEGCAWRQEGCAQGGYVLAESGGRRDATLVATGPEVATALAARALLSRRGIEAAVVSLPCWELFAARPTSYHAAVLGRAPRIGIEAASGFGWERWLGQDGIFIGMDGFGPGPHDTPAPHDAPPDGSVRAPPGGAGITAERIFMRVARHLGAADAITTNGE